MSGVTIVQIKKEDDGMRLNRWFLKYYPGLSLSRLNKLLRTKQIKLDGGKVEASCKLSQGQELRLPPLDNEKAAPIKKDFVSKKDEMFIQSLVIYKDENLLALNKPSGLAVQGGTNTNRHVDGMLDALKFDALEKPKLVHRIDKNTSGLLLLARNRNFAELLTKAFKNHNLQKTYLALCYGIPKLKQGEINLSLSKVGEKIVPDPKGQKAITLYRVLDSVGTKFSLLELSPLTGRTHQIRVHLSAIGCPIVGDDKYFDRQNTKLNIFDDKLHLHAYKINLSDLYNKKMVITAELPDYFKQSLANSGIVFKE